MKNTINYRPDIDGLRAIACLSVVIYHAFPTVLIGGFTGVDIFFVISGFLISSILFRELTNPQNPGKINIIDFYIRRIRRIFPALIAVLITCLALGYFVLFPDEYALLGKHTSGGAVYINNILLYKESGNYFDVASSAKPLLHLWSLGVEEQFYLIFPLILWAIYRFNINFVFGITVFTVISFICNKNAINHSNQTAAFYLPQFRFWELSIGAILAYIVEYHKVFVDKFKQFTKETLIKNIFLRDSNIVIKDSTLNNIFSIIGLLLIIIGILTVKQNLKFPGTRALIPVFGALFIIAVGKEAFINKNILSNKIMVFLGQISYPLYLWHWPLLSFAYICSGDTPDIYVRILAICIAVALSIITYLFIEPPLRYGKYSKIKASALLIILIVLGAIGNFINFEKGIPSRYHHNIDDIKKIQNLHKLIDKSAERCKKTLIEYHKYTDDKECVFQKESESNTVAVIGDSHARFLSYGLIEAFEKDGSESVVRFSISGNPPFLDMIRVDKKNAGLDIALRIAFNHVLNQNNIKFVILANYPIEWFDVHGVDREIIDPSYSDLYKNYKNFSIIDIQDPTEKNRTILLERGLRRTFDLLKKHGKKVIFVMDNPDFFFDPKECIKRNFNPLKNYNMLSNKCNPSRKSLEKNYIRVWYNSILKKVCADYDNVILYNSFDSLCTETTCPLIIDGNLLYRDKDHISVEGSRLIAKDIIKLIKQ